MQRGVRIFAALCVLAIVFIIKSRLDHLRRPDAESSRTILIPEHHPEKPDDASPVVTSSQTSSEDTLTSSSTTHGSPPLSAAETPSVSSELAQAPSPVPGSKIVVMAKLEGDDVDWVTNELPGWQRAIYTVNNINATLHTPANKGREAMAYLTYLIDNYHQLCDTIAFIHNHKEGYPAAWHVENDRYSNVESLQTLKLDYVQRSGYANLRCNFIPGCPDEVQPFRDPPEGQRTTEHIAAKAWKVLFQNADVPKVIGAACCAQFAVSKQQVLKRSLEEYQRYRDWLLRTEIHDDTSGRLFEFLWHIIFGRDPVHCPNYGACLCDTYGRC